MTRIQHTGDSAGAVVYGRYRDDLPTTRFDGDSVDVDADVAAELVARHADVHFDPPRCGVATGDGDPCARVVGSVGATCHQHDRDESGDDHDDRTHLQRVRSEE